MDDNQNNNMMTSGSKASNNGIIIIIAVAIIIIVIAVLFILKNTRSNEVIPNNNNNAVNSNNQGGNEQPANNEVTPTENNDVTPTDTNVETTDYSKEAQSITAKSISTSEFEALRNKSNSSCGNLNDNDGFECSAVDVTAYLEDGVAYLATLDWDKMDPEIEKCEKSGKNNCSDIKYYHVYTFSMPVKITGINIDDNTNSQFSNNIYLALENGDLYFVEFNWEKSSEYNISKINGDKKFVKFVRNVSNSIATNASRTIFELADGKQYYINYGYLNNNTITLEEYN